MTGYHILGASGTDRVITVRVKNALALAKSQSALASAAAIIPGAGADFVEGQAYAAIAQKLGDALADQKVDAEVRVIDGAGIVPSPRTIFSAVPTRRDAAPAGQETSWSFARTYPLGILTGAGLATAAWALWRYFQER